MIEKLKWQLILYPIFIILVTIISLTYYEINEYKKDVNTVLQNTTNTYINTNKEKIKNEVLNVADSIKYQIERNKNKSFLSNKEIQDMVLERYAKNKFTENYLFIYQLHDINGGKEFATMILNQNRPDLIGKKISDDYEDAKGKEFRKEFLEKIRQKGEAYVEYWYKKPKSDDIASKVSYFYYLEEWNWVLAKGFYFDTLNKELDYLKDRVQIRIKDRIKSILTFTLFISLFAILISILISNKIFSLINRYAQQLLQQKQELETIFDSTLDGIAVIDEKGSILQCNKAFCKLTKYSKEELLKKTCQELTHPNDKQKNVDAIEETLKNGLTHNIEKICITKDNQNTEVNMSLSKLPKNEEILLVIHDLTVHKMMLEQSRLASMGEMIGNIAHQWRQPLSIITTSATGVLYFKDSKLLSDEIIEKEMNAINNQAQYLSKTIDDFRNFIKGEIILDNFSINELIDSTLILVESSLKNNYITVIKETTDDIEFYGSLNEFEQALINILNNAKDILIEKNEDERILKITTKKITNNKLELEILDSGGGVPKKVISKVFDPYFTTKHQSQGTGLGLAMVDKIIRERHKQSISVENETFEYNGKTFKGASFKIIFDTTIQMETIDE